MILNRIPILNGPLASAARRVVACALLLAGAVTFGILVYRGGPPDVTSPEILRQVYGCYYLDGRLALLLSPDGMARGSGFAARYEVYSFNGRLKIMIARKLVVALGADGLWRVHVSDGVPLYLPMRLGSDAAIEINTLDFSRYVGLVKAPCQGSHN